MQLRTQKAFIGEREFELSELTCKNRAIVGSLIGGAQLPGLITKVMQIITPEEKPNENKAEKKSDVGDLFTAIASSSGLWESLVGAVIEALGGLTQIILLSLKSGLESEDETYIIDNLTLSQEAEILNVLLELNAIPELIKNYKSLLAKARKLKGL